MHILRLALPKPMRQLFDYLPPQATDVEHLKPGVRIRVPFGRQQLIGVLLEVKQDTDYALDKLKPALEILDEEPVLPDHLVKLACWAAHYYQHPVGDALLQAYPSLLRKGQSSVRQNKKLWRALPEIQLDDVGSRAPKQKALLELILQRPQGISTAGIRLLGQGSEAIKPLEEKQLIESFQPDKAPVVTLSEQFLHEVPLSLNLEQEQALNAINQALDFQVFLLDGVTGCGKTEVYLQAIEKQLSLAKQTMLLVPEIGLTPQLFQRVKERFNLPIVQLHSNMTERQRLDAWLDASSGHARILIGTRSALFTPMPDLGLIILDEEHDASFKQQDGYRYSARDLAVLRAQKEQLPIILGSATPSLESLNNAKQGRYQHLLIRQRANSAPLPQFELLDTQGLVLDAGLSEPLVESISSTLAKGQQVLVFINRRGFAPALSCTHCGWIYDCPRCDAHFTLHRTPPHMHCHHCDKQAAIPHSCGSCKGGKLKPLGAGTERTEDSLQSLFPDHPVLRIDRDSTQTKGALEALLEPVHQAKPCILVGTQMLAKGHHFPNVTLVAILNVDAGLFSTDIRGMERTAQTIIQVAGRAGRAEHKGLVLLQTNYTEHPLLQQLIYSGYGAFAEQELEQRFNSGLPPFSYSAIIRAESLNLEQSLGFLADVLALYKQQSSDPSLLCLGPFSAPMYKKAGMHRALLLLQSPKRAELQQALTRLVFLLEQSKQTHKLRWSIDVDPIEGY